MSRFIFLMIITTITFSACETSSPASSNSGSIAAANNISGAWQSVDNKEFAMINDGFFSSVGQDSTGKWSATHTGTYTIDDANTLTLKVDHSSYAEHVGALHTIEYAVKGDSLTIKWFKKLIDAKSGDITANMPKNEQTQYVRARRQ